MHDLQVEQTSILALRAQDRNARTHTKRQIRQIANSIKRFGFTNPILTDDNLQILAGHGRLEAAKLLDMTTVCEIARNFDPPSKPAQRIEFVTKDWRSCGRVSRPTATPQKSRYPSIINAMHSVPDGVMVGRDFTSSRQFDDQMRCKYVKGSTGKINPTSDLPPRLDIIASILAASWTGAVTASTENFDAARIDTS